ncbi:alanine racemase [Propionicicella superfundia]|uniref:alanine racemase n=1 Tax=Propionicicella superfundia TaxID=348582 RepID=UPI000427B87B|nr:alanine racemase [Propionicicella superfundia]
MTTLADPDTPFAAVDAGRLDRNITRLRERLAGLGVPLRYHVKTAKAVEVASRVFPGGPGPITVSTLAEAEFFADAGYRDILYAVGIDPHKLPRVVRLARRGVAVTVLLDSPAQAEALVAAAREDAAIAAVVEIDTDGQRAGLAPHDPLLGEIGRRLADAGLLAGVLTHNGGSYHARTDEQVRAAARRERDGVLAAARTLREAGLPSPVVSLGSTPTASSADDLRGITEVRAGVYVFQDLVMAGLGVCSLEDIALSVVVTVIGHQPAKGWILTDGGWMALSRDRGTAEQQVDQGYGVVTDLGGAVVPDLLVAGVTQEHGVLALRPGSARSLPALPIGTRLRVLPNHACATAAQFDRYHVVAGGTEIVAEWARVNGW